MTIGQLYEDTRLCRPHRGINNYSKPVAAYMPRWVYIGRRFLSQKGDSCEKLERAYAL
jgi:hypothetical protein